MLGQAAPSQGRACNSAAQRQLIGHGFDECRVGFAIAHADSGQGPHNLVFDIEVAGVGKKCEKHFDCLRLLPRGQTLVVVLEPAGASALSVYSVNQPSLKVSLYAVGPEDFERYVAYMRGVNGYYDARQKQKQYEEASTCLARFGRRLTGVSERAEETLEEIVEPLSLLPPS